MIIIGIDPGLATTGYGIVAFLPSRKKNSFRCIAYGLISTEATMSVPGRLKKLYQELTKIITIYKPDKMAVESIFFFKNLKTALPVSQARGVILLAAAKKKLPVYEATPLQVKMAISGHGRAEKNQMQEIVKVLLGLKETPRPDDAADALAIAIYCANNMKPPDFTDGVSSPAFRREQNPAEAKNLLRVHSRAHTHDFLRRGMKADKITS